MKRINITIDPQIDVEFRKKASQIYQFEKGWYSKAIADAMKSWTLKKEDSNTNAVNVTSSIHLPFFKNHESDLNLSEKNPFESMENITSYLEENGFLLKIERDQKDHIVIKIEKEGKTSIEKNLDIIMLLHTITKLSISSMEETTKDKYEIIGVENIPQIYFKKLPK